ncbi:uncharacterized protein LOC128677013 isoform X2 [Plodia interpunctella]|uniref:uncharacterized protein LOC128677013 isoform X2 n=1 Tax=Plodia interpunctella TaxID=58824 RepID=UPI0023685A02|nr:uncharacterized protein LOC128677013 isoform X2 [Plodia interpunctella]
MDVSEITKVASRKRLNIDAEKLREKVSRETAKIIKLKVAQDTAYWDLKEKLQQVEGNHERLQQNMVEVQMQHEAISGQYQDEIRLRPDTLNKLSSTRDICDVLEEYSERLKDTLSRCKSDQASLCDAYQKSGRFVRDIKIDCESKQAKHQQHLTYLQEKATESTKHYDMMIHHLTKSKEKADSDLDAAKKTLDAMLVEKEDLCNTIMQMRYEIGQLKQDNAVKDERMGNIDKENRRLLDEKNEALCKLKNQIEQKENELRQCSQLISDLRTTVTNQEQFATSLRDENDKLHGEVVTLQGSVESAEDTQRELLATITKLNKENEEFVQNISNLSNCNQELIKKNSEIESRATEDKDQLKSEITDLRKEKHQLNFDLVNSKLQCSNQATEIKELLSSCHNLKAEVNNITTTFEDYKRHNEKVVLDMKIQIEQKEKEVTTKAHTIAQLMCEVGTAGETAARLEAALQKIREESELERQAATEKEGVHKRQLETIQGQIAEKENELTKQMNIILDMRSEKDRLQEKIQNMQSKIDNIQKELSGPQPRVAMGDAPELDDNAVAFAPTPRAHAKTNIKPLPAMNSPVLKVQKKHKNADNGKLDSILFSMFSDTSMDEDSNMIDRHEVDRRFEALARGEPLPPASISSLRRRKLPAGLRVNDDEDLSLSQIKKNIKGNEPRKFFKNMRPGSKK